MKGKAAIYEGPGIPMKIKELPCRKSSPMPFSLKYPWPISADRISIYGKENESVRCCRRFSAMK